jgi:hypothetical protein
MSDGGISTEQGSGISSGNNKVILEEGRFWSLIRDTENEWKGWTLNYGQPVVNADECQLSCMGNREKTIPQSFRLPQKTWY